MRYKRARKLSRRKFKRYVGVKRQTFKQMIEVMKRHTPAKLKHGRPPQLGLEDQVLLALQYWREYRTYFHIGEDWGVSESTACRIVHKVETILIRSGEFALPGKKQLLQAQPLLESVAIDVTESPIERPRHGQRSFFSGKKKQHTLKSLFVVNLSDLKIICTAHGQGRRHDFQVFKASRIRLHPQTEGLEDKGFQGIDKLHGLSHTPRKKPRRGKLSASDKQYNRALAKRRVVVEHISRVVVEHINCTLKVFKILS